MNWRGLLRGGKKGWERGGIQYTANQGQEWTSIRTTSQEGEFQVSKRVKLAFKQKGVSSKDNAKGV
jgi:hypothetical protein